MIVYQMKRFVSVWFSNKPSNKLINQKYLLVTVLFLCYLSRNFCISIILHLRTPYPSYQVPKTSRILKVIVLNGCGSFMLSSLHNELRLFHLMKPSCNGRTFELSRTICCYRSSAASAYLVVDTCPLPPRYWTLSTLCQNSVQMLTVAGTDVIRKVQ